MSQFIKYSTLLIGLIWGSCFASILTIQERAKIEQKLNAVPTNRNTLFSLLFPANNKLIFDQNFQDELESILKSSLLEADTAVALLTPEIRTELDLYRNIVAFHKQGPMGFDIIASRSGEYQGIKQNDTIRILPASHYFIHGHNIFVADEKVSIDNNTFSLLFHELSHAAFDQWITYHPEKLNQYLRPILSPQVLVKLFYKSANGKYAIDGDLYDLLSERYAFELEYRLNTKIANKIAHWPLSFSYTEAPTNKYSELIDDYVRRNYDIDHPALKKFPIQSLEGLLFK
jgi:hypothetical protein